MSTDNFAEKFEHFNDFYSGDAAGERSEIKPLGMTLGIVTDTDDPLQMGRLRIFCPSLNDNPKKIQHLPWAIYISPFGGSINNKGFTRGNDPSNCTTTGAVQYGFWGIPEQGAHVLVGCIDGDIRRRFWMGCAYEHQETHGVLTGRWKWNGGDGLPSGPNSSTNSPIQPTQKNLKKAFTATSSPDGSESITDLIDKEKVSGVQGSSSREWRTRAADYQVCAVREDVGQPPNTSKTTYLDEQYDKISQAEPDSWVKPIDGANGYDWTGYKSLGSFLASRVYGMTTPGFHSFLMDDRAFNCRIKIRSTAGHQIILDDTNERIYMNTYEGNTWLEMDKSGNIDVYAKKRISMHAEQDFNITSDQTVRIMGKQGVDIYAGFNQTQDNLLAPPSPIGEVRIQSEADMHFITRQNLRQLSFKDTLIEIGGKLCETVGQSMFLQVENELNILTNLGDINVTSSANYNEMVRGNTNKFAAGTMAMSSTGNAEVFSFDGKMDVGAQKTMNIKSMSEDVALEAVGANSGKTGGVFQKSPESQHAVSSSGITAATNKSIKHKASQHIEMNNAVPTDQHYPVPPQNIGDCAIGSSVPTEGHTGADLATRLAYNAGFRGDGLVTAVAIAGAESGYNPGAVGDQTLTSDKWGTSVGLWQVRTLNNPGAYSGVDSQRDISKIGGSSNAQNNANTAFALSNGGTNFRPWTTFTSGSYQEQLSGAKSVVNSMCNPMMLRREEQFALTFGAQNLPLSLIENCLVSNALAQGNAFVMTTEGLVMKSLNDIGMKGLLSSTTIFSGLYTKINQNALAHDLLSLATQLAFAAQVASGYIVGAALFVSQLASCIGLIKGLVGHSPNFKGIFASLLQEIEINLLLESVCSYKLPHFDPAPEVIFFGGNFDLQNSTNLNIPGLA